MALNGSKRTPTLPSGSGYRSASYGAGQHEGMVVDLSEFAERLVNYEDISAELSEDQERRIVDYVKSMVDMSHNKISKRYDHWKEADRAHDVYVRLFTAAHRNYLCRAQRKRPTESREISGYFGRFSRGLFGYLKTGF